MSSPYFVVSSGLSGLGRSGKLTDDDSPGAGPQGAVTSPDEWAKFPGLSPPPLLSSNAGPALPPVVGTAVTVGGGVLAGVGVFRLVTGKGGSGVPMALAGGAAVVLGVWLNRRSNESALTGRAAGLSTARAPTKGVLDTITRSLGLT